MYLDGVKLITPLNAAPQIQDSFGVWDFLDLYQNFWHVLKRPLNFQPPYVNITSKKSVGDVECFFVAYSRALGARHGVASVVFLYGIRWN